MDEKRVLIVDDDAATGEVFRLAAHHAGMTAVAVDNVVEAKARIREWAPDVIVLDMVMPDADGIEMATWLATEGFQGRVVFVSGYSEAYLQAASTMAHARGLSEITTLTKPVSVEALREALRL